MLVVIRKKRKVTNMFIVLIEVVIVSTLEIRQWQNIDALLPFWYYSCFLDANILKLYTYSLQV